MQPLTSDTFFVDNSMLELIQTCPYLAYVSILRRRKPAGESPALRFGGHLHRALAYRYRMQAYGKAVNESAMLRILDHAFRSTPCENEGWRNYDSAVKTVRGYNATYEREDFSVASNPMTGFPYVEQPLAVDTHKRIRGRRIIYTGRIDAKVRFPDNSTYTLDHKTTSMMGDTFWIDQQMTGQHKGYIWADRECTGEECTGYIVNAIGVKESINNAEFDAELGQVVAGKTLSGKRSTATPLELARQRFFTRVPSGQIDEWFDNMLSQVDLFLYCVERNGEDPTKWYLQRHQKHCIMKYGTCSLYNICSLPEASRESALASSAYDKNEWTPLYH